MKKYTMLIIWIMMINDALRRLFFELEVIFARN